MPTPADIAGAPAAAAAEFLVTKEHRRFTEFAHAVRHHRYIGVCYGSPGVGKTISARRHAHWDALEPWLREHRLGGEDAPAIIEDARTVFYTPTTFVGARQLDHDLSRLCTSLAYAIYDHRHPNAEHPQIREPRDQVELVIVDEADRLKTATLEQLRDFFDRRDLGVILIGMPGLEKRLARYPQLYSRIGFAHRYQPLSPEELRFVLAHHWQRLGLGLSAADFTDAEAVAAISRTTNGNFRLIQRLFTQIERVLEINHLRTITAEVVDAARETLVIGPT